MSDGLRAVAFGSPDGSLWGAAILGDSPALVLGAGAEALGVADGLSVEDAGADGWRLRGERLELTLTPLAPPVPDADAPTRPGTPWTLGTAPELCAVTGHATAGGEFSGVGVRVALPPTKGGVGSARLVGTWLPDGAALALLAARPRKAEHPDEDVVAASLFDPEGWLAVADPRLSSTYDGAGAPTRMNLELWVTEGETEFPRRAAGEVRGSAGSVSGEGVALHVAPLHCHSRGEQGAGVYALATLS